jgi:hypothetical protein
MAHETDGTFSTEIQSYNPSVNSQGLIQFTQATARRMGTTLKHLSNLSRVEQMDWVRKFLEENQGNYDSIYDVVAQIYGGDPAFRRFNRAENPAKEMMRKPKWRRYLKGLGRQTGRKYRFPTDRRKMSSQRVHDRQTDGCPECNKMMEEHGFVTPHMIG